MITPETIIKDISEALNTTDLVPDVNHNGKDYLSYRYRWNDTRPIVLIRVYNEHHYEVVTGKKCYDITDDEIYEALKPLIVKKVKAVYDAACAEIAYRDDEMSVIMHGDDTRELWMFVNKGDEKYSATYYAKSGRVSLGMVPLEFTERYMELVKEYFLPFVEEHKEAK